MLIPRYNNFAVELPNTMLPQWCIDLWADILKDAGLAKVYNGNPNTAIQEGLVGIAAPGMHLKLTEQVHQDAQKTGSITTYYPKGVNNMRVLDDNEISLQFRHIDGFLTYYMLRDAIAYTSDDNAQRAQGETFKTIGDIAVKNLLTPNYFIRTVYQQVVYSSIDGNEFAYNKMASENTFNVRLKFTYYYSELWYKDKCISQRMYNHNQGN